jgi:hypothetical protein
VKLITEMEDVDRKEDLNDREEPISICGIIDMPLHRISLKMDT